MKIKQYGKNKIAFKKLVSDEDTKITLENGIDFKDTFSKLIGYDFVAKKVKNGLELTDCTGDKIYIETNLSIEMV